MIKIMWILNITPDSFYDGGRFVNPDDAKQQIEKMISQWVDIIDVWWFSSRPWAEIPSVDDELERIIPILEILKNYNISVSVDTFRYDVVKKVLTYKNVDYINDISGLSDESIVPLLVNSWVSYVLMHTKWSPKNMQNNPNYENIIWEISEFFQEKINILEKSWVKNIILDPGFGFWKTIEHNYEILKNMNSFRDFWYDLFAGISRKSMIYKPLELSPANVLPETVGLGAVLMQNNIDILRVHDVAEHAHVRKLLSYMK